MSPTETTKHHIWHPQHQLQTYPGPHPKFQHINKPHQSEHIPDLGFWDPHIRHHLFMTKNLPQSHAPAVRLCIRIILLALRHDSPQPVVWNGRVWRVRSDGRWPKNAPNFNDVIYGRICRIEPFACNLTGQHTKSTLFISAFAKMHLHSYMCIYRSLHILIHTYAYTYTCLSVHISELAPLLTCSGDSVKCDCWIGVRNWLY